MKVEDLETGDGPDTALARALHASGVLELAALRACLDEARAGSRALAELLVERELLDGASLSRAFVGQPASREGPLHLGEVVAGRYQVTELLGIGGMGAVYGVRELAGRRDLALKVILPEVVSEVDLQRFRQEGEIAARLGAAQGFVVVHAAGEHRGLSWFVMERIEGRDLKAALAEGLPLPQLVEILAAVARSLHACHEQGIVHRDLKPANVLLTASGPKVADLGLARERDRETLTETGDLLGTPAYMAPEQLVDARRVDARTDVYSLGAILYRGLTGRPPFEGPLYQVLEGIASHRPDDPLRADPSLPAGLVGLCLRALAKDPGERPASALEFAHALAGAEQAGRARRPGLGAVSLIVVLLALSLWAASAAREGALRPPARAAATSSPSLVPEPGAITELLAGDQAPRDLRRAATTWGERASAQIGSHAARALKRAAWDARRADELERLTSGPEPGARLRQLSAILLASPALEAEVAGISGRALDQLGERWLEARGGREALYERGCHLQRVRDELELGDAPRWLQEIAFQRFQKSKGGVVDCLRLGVPLRSGLSFAMVKRYGRRDSLRGQEEGWLAIYWEFALVPSYALRAEAGEPQRDKLLELRAKWRTLPDRVRDLSRRHRLEAEAFGLSVAARLLGCGLTEGGSVREEAQALARRCRDLRRGARHELILVLAEIEQDLLRYFATPQALVELWQEALEHLRREARRSGLRVGARWQREKTLGYALVHLATAQLEVSPAEALRICEALERRREELTAAHNHLDPTARRIEVERGRILISAYRRQGRFGPGAELVERYVGVGALKTSPELGIEAMELLLEAGFLEQAEKVLRILREAGFPQGQLQALGRRLDQLRSP